MTTEPVTNVAHVNVGQLFSLQAQCGAWGLLLGVFWTAGVVASTDHVFPNIVVAILIFGIIATLFLAPILISSGYQGFVEGNDPAVVRRILRLCSASCILAICLLIWSTGGAHSAFTPFYVMTYTLTLERIEMSTGKWRLFFAFVMPVLLACIVERFISGPLIEDKVLNELLTSNFHFVAVTIGIGLAMFVPTVSVAMAERKLRKQRLELSSEASR